MSRAGSEVDDFIGLMHGSDPVRVELSRLENEVRDKFNGYKLFLHGLWIVGFKGVRVAQDKDRELGDAHAEIKGLKHSERLKEKAVEELTDELEKVDEKLKATEALLESKHLENKKINDEKVAALSAQYAAEATLRRVHAAQKDDEMPPIEAIIAPLEAELNLSRLEVAKLQDDNRALDRLTKSKEAALLEAERTIQLALVTASLVDDLQNKNQDLIKQIEICQEENRILDKMHRQKVAEVEKLTQTVRELEEAVLAGGAAANAVRDYQRKVQEMNEEKKTMDRELARAKVTANRVAVVVANEWKDGNDKVMPGEMQQLRDKLAIVERTAKAEAQLKVLEERHKVTPGGVSCPTSEVKSRSNGLSRRQSLGGAENLSRISPNGFLSRKTIGSIRSNGANATENDNRPTNAGEQVQSNGNDCKLEENGDGPIEKIKTQHEDYVSGMLYDMLQKEVITLRKACHEKDQGLKDKDDAIEEKYQLRFKVLEERHKATPGGVSCPTSEVKSRSNGLSRRQSLGGAENLSRISPNGFLSRKTIGSIRSNGAHATEYDHRPTNAGEQVQSNGNDCKLEENGDGPIEKIKTQHEDYVSGMLYDMLQKEVITLRKACHEKDQGLKDKDDAIEEKYQLRFKVLEERHKATPGGVSCPTSEVKSRSNGLSRRQSLGGAENLSRISPNGFLSRKTIGSIRSNGANATENDNRPTNAGEQVQSNGNDCKLEENGDGPIEKIKTQHEDYVSGMLYDMLQKEVITLRKACHEKDQGLKDKDDAIEVLT
ncbi:hypothetical protein RJ640_012073 [Escallonia rubra]|uniref:Uncharacterized protein n=1 Tax=Escallonia rubra TaxID=112253 RepID=A0AA88USI0_9ASTE|nr:hypothetical protein RJ640_012073 [Escallonia rubra]